MKFPVLNVLFRAFIPCFVLVSTMGIGPPFVAWSQGWDYSSVEITNTGRYKAFVVQHPNDKRKVKGFLHLTAVVSPSMLERSSARSLGGGGLYPHQGALERLVEALNIYTDIKTDLGQRVALSDPGLFAVPWVFISSDVFYPTDAELTNLGRYLLRGGFLFLDAGTGIGCEKDINLRHILKRALSKVGKPCEFRRLSKSHRIFHCYFDFNTVPLSTSGGIFGGRSKLLYPDYLIGVDVDGRTAAVLCYADIGRTWRGLGTQNLRSLQFGINTVIYALTQKGSITERIVRDNLGRK